MVYPQLLELSELVPVRGPEPSKSLGRTKNKVAIRLPGSVQQHVALNEGGKRTVLFERPTDSSTSPKSNIIRDLFVLIRKKVLTVMLMRCRPNFNSERLIAAATDWRFHDIVARDWSNNTRVGYSRLQTVWYGTSK